MKVETKTLKTGHITGYKVTDYEKWDSAAYLKTAKDDKDWSGFYIAETEALAKGYISDKVDPKTGKGLVYFQEIQLLKDIPVIVCKDDSFKTGEIDMKSLKEAVSKETGIQFGKDDLFMPKLGEKGYLFMCYNNPSSNDMEIIIPNKLISLISVKAYKKCTVKNYSVLESCTSL